MDRIDAFLEGVDRTMSDSEELDITSGEYELSLRGWDDEDRAVLDIVDPESNFQQTALRIPRDGLEAVLESAP